MESLILDYIDGDLDGELKSFVETQIEKNELYRKFYQEQKKLAQLLDADTDEEPPSSIRDGFHKDMEQYLEEPKVVPLYPTWMKIAAAISLLVVGFLTGRTFLTDNSNQISALQNEMAMTREVVNRALDHDVPTSERLESIRVSYEVDAVDKEILETLIHTMDNDDNVNVRLAAIKGLSRFTKEPIVRDALVKSLTLQEDPVLQVFLINIIVEMEETKAIENLKEITEDESIEQTVRDEAQLGIFELS